MQTVVSESLSECHFILEVMNQLQMFLSEHVSFAILQKKHPDCSPKLELEVNIF